MFGKFMDIRTPFMQRRNMKVGNILIRNINPAWKGPPGPYSQGFGKCGTK